MNKEIGFFGLPVSSWVSPPCGPPLLPLIYCLERIEATIGRSMGFNDLFTTRLENGISEQSPPSA